MVEEGSEMFDLCHVEHKEYMLNGAVVVGRATSVDEDQGLVYVGLKGSMGAQGERRDGDPALPLRMRAAVSHGCLMCLLS
jgi:hypothetical protein